MILKITPGPWYVRNPDDAGNAKLGIVSDGTRPPQGIAYTVGLHTEADLANARAIAEVPAMIDALRELLRVNHEQSGPVSGNIVTGNQRADAGDLARAILKRIES